MEGAFAIVLRPELCSTAEVPSRNRTAKRDLSSMANSKDHGIVRHERGEDQPKDEERVQQTSKTPAAGPHAKPELTDDSKTPGAGTLPDPGKSDDSTSG